MWEGWREGEEGMVEVVGLAITEHGVRESGGVDVAYLPKSPIRDAIDTVFMISYRLSCIWRDIPSVQPFDVFPPKCTSLQPSQIPQ